VYDHFVRRTFTRLIAVPLAERREPCLDEKMREGLDTTRSGQDCILIYGDTRGMESWRKRGLDTTRSDQDCKFTVV